jgi:hypothetical protein
VDEPTTLAEVGAVDLTGHVEHATAGRQRLDHRAGGVAGTGARAGDGDAQAAGDPALCVGRVHRRRLVADRDEATVRRHRVDEREVVDTDDAVRRLDAGGVHQGHQEVAPVGTGQSGMVRHNGRLLLPRRAWHR